MAPTSPTAPVAPTPQPTKPIVKSSENRPSAAAAFSVSQEDDHDHTDREEIKREDGSGSKSDTDDAKTNTQAPPPPVRPPTKPLPQSPLPKPIPPKPSSDFGSGPDSPQDDATPDPSIKPINTKPVDGPALSGNPVVSPASTLGQASFTSKGVSVDTCHKDNGGHQWFQRLWSLDDEITLLNGVLEYRLKNGCFPSRTNGMDAVRDRIKGSLHMEVITSQLVNKLRSLKKKFQKNVTLQKNGTGPTFTRHQEQVAFKLSNKLWGIDKVTAQDVGASPAKEDNELCEREIKVNDGNLMPVDVSQYPSLWETLTKMADEELCGVAIKRALEMLDDVKANLMEEKLKKLRTTQLKLHRRRTDLDTKTLKLIFDAIIRSG